MATLAVAVAGMPTVAQQPIIKRNVQRRNATAQQTTSPLVVAHHTFERAAKIMESALPIYDGHRHRAIGLAKLAAKEIREAATGTTTGANGAVATRKTAAQRAAQVPRGNNVELSKYSSGQIAASNAAMQQGLQLLQQGMQQVQAIGNDSGNHMSDALTFGNEAVQAANTGLQYVAGKSSR